MFKLMLGISFLCLISIASSSSIAKNPTKSKSPCMMCNVVMDGVKKILQSNQNEDEILSLIEKRGCSQLGSLKDKCTKLIQSSGKELLADLANDVDYDTVCKKFRLCVSSNFLSVYFTSQIIKANKVSNDSNLCDECLDFINKLAGIAGDDLDKFVDHICALTPSPDSCSQDLALALGFILEIITGFNVPDAHDICHALSFC